MSDDAAGRTRENVRDAVRLLACGAAGAVLAPKSTRCDDDDDDGAPPSATERERARVVEVVVVESAKEGFIGDTSRLFFAVFVFFVGDGIVDDVREALATSETSARARCSSECDVAFLFTLALFALIRC